MRPPLSYVPILPITIGLIAGILLASAISSIALIVVVAIIAVMAYYRRKTAVAIVLIAIVLGWVNTNVRTSYTPDEECFKKTLLYSGTVQTISEKESARYLVVEIDSIATKHSPFEPTRHFKCRITIPSYNPIVDIGDKISFSCKLRQISNDADLPDEWDYARYYWNNGIRGTAYVSPKTVQVKGKASGIIWSIKRLRPKVTRAIATSSLKPATIEFLNATIAGDSSMITTETRLEYASSGLAHILALSGLHVGIMIIVITIALFPLYVGRYDKLRCLITIVLLWLYAIMTGLSPSVTRAVIMATIYLTSSMIQRPHSSMNALCLAALVILFFDPLSIYSAGFQMSFAAVASILLFARRLNPINPRNRILYKIVSLATISLSAMIGTALVAAYYFHTFPVYFLLANVLIVYLLPLILGGGVLLVVLSVIGYDPVWLCSILDFLYDVLHHIAIFTNSLPGATIKNIYVTSWVFIPYILTIASLLIAMIYRQKRWVMITCFLAFLSIIIGVFAKPHFNKTEYFITRNTYYTNLILRDSNVAYIVTTALKSDSATVYDRCMNRYADYFGRRHIDTVMIVPKNFNSPHLSCQGRMVVAGTDRICVINNDNDVRPMTERPHYALVCRGFKGDIVAVSRVLHPDTILLSKDLDVRRHNRYVKTCDKFHIPYKSLRESALHRVINQ